MISTLVPIFFPAVAAPAPPPPSGSSFSSFTETWPGALGAAPPVAWTTLAGSPQQSGGNFLRPNVAVFNIVRDAGGTDGIIIVNTYSTAFWPYIIFRSDSTRTVFSYLIWRQDTGKVQYNEQNSGSVTATVDGTTSFPVNTLYPTKIILSGTSVTVQVDSGSGFVTEISTTAALGLLNTYMGMGTAVSNGSDGDEFGTVTVGP